MSPIEIYIDKKFVGRSSSSPSVIKLPNPPGGKVVYHGDKSGFGEITAGPHRSETFGFTKPGERAIYEVMENLSGLLFPTATNSTKKEIVIKRV